MKLTSFLWTGLFAAILFFSLVFLGMKYNWVNDAKPKYTHSEAVRKTNTSGSMVDTLEKDKLPTSQTGHGSQPELIDEPTIQPSHQTSILGSTALSIEQIVDQCRSVATSVGIPEQQFDQSVLECIDRNSGHLQAEVSEPDERSVRIREQCELAITQRELLSAEEIKMLVDECVASMQ